MQAISNGRRDFQVKDFHPSFNSYSLSRLYFCSYYFFILINQVDSKCQRWLKCEVIFYAKSPELQHLRVFCFFNGHLYLVFHAPTLEYIKSFLNVIRF